MAATIGVDLGGTKLLVAAVDEHGGTRGHVKMPTPVTGPVGVVKAIAELVRQVDEHPAAVGIGAPGPISSGLVLEAPNLVGWHGPTPLADMVAEEAGAPVVLANDANAGTLAEARFGAARDGVDVLGCFLGTGIGGGLVMGGHIREGASGTAGELGHVPVQMVDARRCDCGREGCLEAYAGRASLQATVERAVAAGETTLLTALALEKGKDKLTSGVWRSALKAGDPLATRLVGEAVQALGVAIAGVVNMVDVDTVVFGGGLTEKLGQALVDDIAAAARPRLISPDAPRRWVIASLGDDAVLIGAAELARGAG